MLLPSLLQDHTVLIAEDDSIIRDGLARFLKNRCRIVYTAQDGATALKTYREKAPDIFLTDILMPTFNGLEVVQKIRKNDDRTLIFIMTSEPTENYLLEAIKLQLEKFIIKPILHHQLLSELEQSCNKLKNGEQRLSQSADLFYSPASKMARIDDQTISLTHMEILLLELLLRFMNQVVTYEQIEQVVYEGKEMNITALRMLIKRLKNKLPGIQILAHAELGYRLHCL